MFSTALQMCVSVTTDGMETITIKSFCEYGYLGNKSEYGYLGNKSGAHQKAYSWIQF